MSKINSGLRREFPNFLAEWNKGLDKYFIGVEKFFDEFYELIDVQQGSTAYPPYNMYKDEDGSIIEIALAGFKKENIRVTIEKYYGCQKLKVLSQRIPSEKEALAEANYLHRGIAQRLFERTFIIYEDSEIESVKLSEGILKIKVKKIPKDVDSEVKVIEVQ